MSKNTVKTPRPVGRPAAKIVWPNKIFTMKDLVAANPGVCKLTVINHTKAELDSSFLTRLNETVKTGKVGKPAHKFVKTSILARRQARKGATTPTTDPTVTPEVSLVEAPAEVAEVVAPETVSAPQPEAVTA